MRRSRRRNDDDDVPLFAAWLCPLYALLVLWLSVIGVLMAYPTTAGFREFWQADGMLGVSTWHAVAAMLALVLIYAVAIFVRRRAPIERVIAGAAVGICAAFLVAMGSMKRGPLDDRWYLAVTHEEPTYLKHSAFAVIRFESPVPGPCADAPGRCVLLERDDGRWEWLTLGPGIKPWDRIVVVQRVTGRYSGREARVVLYGVEAEDWELYWGLHMYRMAQLVDTSGPLEY